MEKKKKSQKFWVVILENVPNEQQNNTITKD